MEDRRIFLQKLGRIQKLAEGSRMSRFLSDPLTYVKGMTWSKFLYRWSGKVLKVKKTTFFGHKMRLGLPAGLDIYLLGAKSHDSEIRLATFLLRYLKKGNIFFDIGAHVGYFSLLAEKCVGESGKIVGFEASPSTFAYYKTNTSLYHHIVAEHLAVSNEQGEVVFYEFPMLYSEYNSINGKQYEEEKWSTHVKAKKVSVPSVSLDEYCKTKNTFPDFIKIDVEGAEWLVLSGAEYVLKTFKPVVILEFINPVESEKSNSAHVRAVEFLMGQGYDLFVIDVAGNLEKKNHIDDLFGFIESDNIVCMHPEKIAEPCM